MLVRFPGTVVRYLNDPTVDLALAEYLCGGIVRIPNLGGLKSADKGYFPEYDADQFLISGTQVIIGSGLGNHCPIPRILNKPGIVIVDPFQLARLATCVGKTVRYSYAWRKWD